MTALAWVHPRRCLGTHPIRAGEVLRCPASTSVGLRQLIGYDVGCPSCGFRSTWVAARAGGDTEFTEGPVVEDSCLVIFERQELEVELKYWHPSTLSAEQGRVCRRCGKLITIRDGEISAA